MNEVLFIGATFGLKAGVLIGLGLALTRILEPGRRLGFLRALLVAVLALPVLALLLPAWMLPLLPSAEPGVATLAAVEPGSLVASVSGADWLQWLLGVYLAGVVLLVARLLYHYRVLRRWARQAQPLAARGIVLSSSGKQRLRIGWCERIEVPLSFGWLQPQVLIPASWRDEQGERVSHALAHELAHIERHDWLWLVLIRVVHALTWWNPLIYPLLRLLNEETELACDRRALARVRSPMSYARSLLSLAGDPILAAVPMSGGRHWRRRLQYAIHYDSKELPMNRIPTALAALLPLTLIFPLAACQIVRAGEAPPEPIAANAPDVVSAAPAAPAPAPAADPAPVRATDGQDYFAPVADPTPVVAPTPAIAPTPATAPKLADAERQYLRAPELREESEQRRAEFLARRQEVRAAHEIRDAQRHRGRAEVQARRAAMDAERLGMRGEQERLGALAQDEARVAAENRAVQAELEAMRRELEATREELERTRMELERFQEG